jgi:hypothetical protein
MSHVESSNTVAQEPTRNSALDQAVTLISLIMPVITIRVLKGKCQVGNISIITSGSPSVRPPL